MTKYLRCHTAGVAGQTVGERYEIIHEDDRLYTIRGFGGYTKLPDSGGDSYRNWFILETDEGSGNITVLPDESLGGIEREYREVKRKAAEGELVKVFGHTRAEANGIFKVLFVEHRGYGFADLIRYEIDGDNGYGTPYHDGNTYVTLEPTDIVHLPVKGRISGTERLRMVERKATVGERVIIVNEGRESCGGAYYRKGNVGYFVDYGQLYGNIRVSFDGTSRKSCVSPGDYRVLEPLTTAPLLSEQSAQDQAAATISALALRLDALTERMDALEAKVDAAYTTQPTTTVDPEAVLKAVRKFSEGLKRSVSDAFKTPQQRRDEIVERAKDDVADLLSHNYPDAAVAGVWLSERDWITVTDECEFTVNPKKRTVVALIRELETGKKNVILCGIARCAPGDVFNAHIGRAISLRRALGLEVPAEYLSVPQPTEVRKGDAVRSTSGIYTGVKGYVDEITYEDSSPSGIFFKHSRANRRDGRIYKSIRFVEVIDDTREEVAA